MANFVPSVERLGRLSAFCAAEKQPACQLMLST